MAALTDVIGLGVLLKWKDQATANIKKTEKAVDQLGDSIDETEKRTAKLQAGFAKLTKVGAGITAFGLAGAATLFGVSKAAGTFEDTLRDTMTMTGLTGQAFKDMENDLGKLALSMSTKMGLSGNEINKAFYQVLSAGAQAGTDQFKGLSESALKLARVVGMEPAIAVESLSDALHSFEMDVKNAEVMADVFFKTSMLGATTVPQMSEAMREASKVAVELKIPLSDVSAVLTGFASKGIKGVQAGTAFRMVMSRLAAPVGAAEEALTSLGVSIYDSSTKKMRPVITIFEDMKAGLARLTHQQRESTLKAIAGEEVFAKLGGLLASDLSLLKGWSKELKVGGVIQTAFTQKTQTLNFAATAMRESLRNIVIIIGRHLLPVITPAITKIAVLAGYFRDFLTAHPVLTKTIVLAGALVTAIALIAGPLLTVVGIVGALGGLPVILGMITSGFASLSAATAVLGGVLSTALWPITAIVTAVALLYLAFKHNFLGIGDIVKGLYSITISFFKGLWSGVKSGLTPFIQSFKEIWRSLKTAFMPLVEVSKQLSQLLGLTSLGSKSISHFSDIAMQLGKVIGLSLIIPMKVLLTSIVYLVKGMSWLISSVIQAGGRFAKVFITVKNIVVKTIDIIKNSMSTLFDWLVSKFNWILRLIPQPLIKALSGSTSLKSIEVQKTISGHSLSSPIQPAKAGQSAIKAKAPSLTSMKASSDNVDQSINIQQGAVVINATKVDESVAIKIDRELAKIMERRRERR